LPIQKLSPNFEAAVGVEANAYQYNGKELNEDFGLHWMDYGARWYDPQINRWGQIDPLAEKYANVSPYVYVGNNPMIYLDPNGKENMIYLLFLPSAQVSAEARKEIQSQMQAIFDSFFPTGTVSVIDFAQSGSNIINGSYLDPSDSFVAFGSVEELKSIASDCFYSCSSADDFIKRFIGSPLNPESSENNGSATGRFVGIDAAELEGRSAKDAGMVGALLGAHGLGHNAGMGDTDYSTNSVGGHQGLNQKGIMASGDARGRMINSTENPVNVSEFINPKNNTREIGYYKQKFNGKSPSDNYKKNQDTGKMITPR